MIDSMKPKPKSKSSRKPDKESGKKPIVLSRQDLLTIARLEEQERHLIKHIPVLQERLEAVQTQLRAFDEVAD